ncbi:Hypothetical protein FKW44_007534, partial [Caligus rogercresseyi]
FGQALLGEHDCRRKANSTNLQQAVTGGRLFKFFGEGLTYSKIRPLFTDAVLFCLKAGRELQNMFHNLIK